MVVPAIISMYAIGCCIDTNCSVIATNCACAIPLQPNFASGNASTTEFPTYSSDLEIMYENEYPINTTESSNNLTNSTESSNNPINTTESSNITDTPGISINF